MKNFIIIIVIIIIIIAFKGAIRDFLRYSRCFTISSQRREPSPTRTLKWPGRSRVQVCHCAGITYLDACLTTPSVPVRFAVPAHCCNAMLCGWQVRECLEKNFMDVQPDQRSLKKDIVLFAMDKWFLLFSRFYDAPKVSNCLCMTLCYDYEIGECGNDEVVMTKGKWFLSSPDSMMLLKSEHVSVLLCVMTTRMDLVVVTDGSGGGCDEGHVLLCMMTKRMALEVVVVVVVVTAVVTMRKDVMLAGQVPRLKQLDCFTTQWGLASHRLVGLVVKASHSRAEDPGFDFHLRHGNFSGTGLTSDLKTGTPVATLQGARRFRVSAGTCWPGVSIL